MTFKSVRNRVVAKVTGKEPATVADIVVQPTPTTEGIRVVQQVGRATRIAEPSGTARHERGYTGPYPAVANLSPEAYDLIKGEENAVAMAEFATDAEATINDELDAVLEPDTRVLTNEPVVSIEQAREQFAIDGAVADGYVYIKYPVAAELPEDLMQPAVPGEYLTGFDFQQPQIDWSEVSIPRPVSEIVAEMDDIAEADREAVQSVQSKLMTVKLDVDAEPLLSALRPYGDLLKSAELGLPLAAYQWINGKFSELENHVEAGLVRLRSEIVGNAFVANKKGGCQ